MHSGPTIRQRTAIMVTSSRIFRTRRSTATRATTVTPQKAIMLALAGVRARNPLHPRRHPDKRMPNLTSGRCTKIHWTFWAFRDHLWKHLSLVDPHRQPAGPLKLLQTQRQRVAHGHSQKTIHPTRKAGYLVLTIFLDPNRVHWPTATLAILRAANMQGMYDSQKSTPTAVIARVLERSESSRVAHDVVADGSDPSGFVLKILQGRAFGTPDLPKEKIERSRKQNARKTEAEIPASDLETPRGKGGMARSVGMAMWLTRRTEVRPLC